MDITPAVSAVIDGGRPMSEVAREFGIARGKLRWAVEKERDRRKAAGDPGTAEPEVTVTGKLDKDGSGIFTWNNVDEVPTEAQIRQVISIPGNNPDDFEWWIYNMDLAFSDSSWQRSKETADTMPGVKGTAYTGPSKRGKVQIKIEKRKVADLADLELLRVTEPRPAAYRCVNCGTWFDKSRIDNLHCSAKCRKEAAVLFETNHGVIRHVIIPDTQVKPGVPTDHLYWAGRYIREECAGQRTRIIHIGDHWDMQALSSYDKGKKAAENRRYKDDLASGNRAFEVLEDAMGDDPMWDKHLFFGNHEDRINRYVENLPELEGYLSVDNLVTPATWTRHQFLTPADLDGILYSHYFYQPNTGKALGSAIEARIKDIGQSFVMGHQQGLRIGTHYTPTGDARGGVVAGSFYQHDEAYKGEQGNHHWRGIVVLNDVSDGSFDPMPVSMDYLCRRYEGHRIWEHTGVIL